MASPEEIIICPYNRAHSIISNRMQFHLTRCRAQHPHAEKTICPFNSTHVVNRIELDVHQRICDDRIVLDSFISKLGTSSKPCFPNKETESVKFDEDWNNELLDESVLENVKKDSLNKPTLTVLIGAPKSERKAHRFHERLRIQRVLDEKINEEKNKSETKSNGKKKNPNKANHPNHSDKCPKTDTEETVKTISDENYVPCEQESKEECASKSGFSLISAGVSSANKGIDGQILPDQKIENVSVLTTDKEVKVQSYAKITSGDGGNSEATINSSVSRTKSIIFVDKTLAKNVISPSKICNSKSCDIPKKADPKVDVPITVKKDCKRPIFSPWKTNNTSGYSISHIDKDDFPALPMTGRARGRLV